MIDLVTQWVEYYTFNVGVVGSSPTGVTKHLKQYIMLNKIIRVLIIVAIIALVINIFPSVYEWCVKGIEWVIAQGKWGIVALVACVIESLLGGN